MKKIPIVILLLSLILTSAPTAKALTYNEIVAGQTGGKVLGDGTGVQFTVGKNGLTSLIFNGKELNYKYGEGLVTSLTFAGQNLVYGPACTNTLSQNTVTSNCVVNGNSFNTIVQFIRQTNDTVRVDMTVNNTSNQDISNIMFSVLGIQMTVMDKLMRGNVVSYVQYNNAEGTYYLWANNPSFDRQILIVSGCGSQAGICKNQPIINTIAKGTSKDYSISMKFIVGAFQESINIVPEAYEAYRTTNPIYTHWPDRRPIVRWFIAEGTKRSVTNPRGYFQDASINITDQAKFSARALATAKTQLDQILARPVRPQGIILWDIEGQEFNHAITYIGDPRAFASGYAPEMNAVIDQIFSTFSNAGLRVGVTLRPQYMQFGTTLPTSCHYDTSNEFKDVFIKVDAPYQQAFYTCDDTAGKMMSIVPVGNGSQTIYKSTQVEEVYQLLKQKTQYAKNRWGATLFYVDSAVWSGGRPIDPSIFQRLQQDFPDSLFIPEQEEFDTLSATFPFTDPRNPGDAKYSPIAFRYAYPTGAYTLAYGDCSTGSCWTNNQWSFSTGMRNGDIALYAVPSQMNVTGLSNLETAIVQARTDLKTFTITDTVSKVQVVVTGNPETAGTYPGLMRVRFAKDAQSFASGTKLCQPGWLGETTCSVDLSGLTVYRVEYIDYDGQIVSLGQPVVFTASSPPLPPPFPQTSTKTEW